MKTIKSRDENYFFTFIKIQINWRNSNKKYLNKKINFVGEKLNLGKRSLISILFGMLKKNCE